MGTPRVSIGGVPLTNAAAFVWKLSSGVAPYQTIAIVHDSQWKRVKKMLGKPQTLSIKSDTAKSNVFKNVYAIREVPTTKPYLRAVVLSDIRWVWQRVVVHGDFNVTRRTGSRRLVNADVIELAQVADSYKYTAASMDGENRWTPRRLLEEVLERVTSATPVSSVKFDSFPIKDGDGRGVTVQNLMLGEGGASAVSRALAFAPGADIYVDQNGGAHVYDGVDLDATEKVRKKLGPATVLGQIDEVMSLKPIRPKRIDVFFTREIELRFDSIEESAEESRYANQGATEFQWGMVNMIQLPDPMTEIEGEKFAAGSFVPIKLAVKAWNAQFPRPAGAPTLDLENIRKHWFWLESVYTAIGELDPSSDDKNWTARIAAIRKHYRQTYQIPRPWMERIKEVKATRVGILDPFTGYRGSTTVWTDYTRVPTNKYRMVNKNKREGQFFWLGMDKYPGEDESCLKSEAAPASVTFIEPDLGILRVEFASDPYGMYSATHPSLMKPVGSKKVVAPDANFAAGMGAQYSEDGKIQNVAPIALSPDHRIAVIITAVPASPNSKERLERIKIKPDDVAKDLRKTFQVSGGKGPVWELYVPPSIMTAWYAWQEVEAARNTSRILFGFNDSAPQGGGGVQPVDTSLPAGAAGPQQESDGSGIEIDIDTIGDDLDESPRDGYVVLNDGDTDSHLFNIAKAFAAAQWAAFTEAAEGTRSVHMTTGLVPTGSIGSIGHRVGADGRLSTEVAMSSERRPIDPMSLMPIHTRSLILGGIPASQP